MGTAGGMGNQAPGPCLPQPLLAPAWMMWLGVPPEGGECPALGETWGQVGAPSLLCSIQAPQGTKTLPPQPRGSNAPEMAQDKGSPREAHTQGPALRRSPWEAAGKPKNQRD